jgi:alkylhydroperoxidase family enzyme
MSRLPYLTTVLLAGAAAFPAVSPAAEEGARRGPAAPLSDGEAWVRLPKAQKGGGQPLPSWAKMLAGTVPRSTAAFLQLDLAHRTRSPVDPKLRAAMRWVAAHANRCAYAEAYAAADARRAGLDDARLDALAREGYPGWSDSERAALDFARKMTVDSDSVTDDEFARLVKDFGANRAASMVLLLAYANFQDRVLLCLRAPVEPGGPLPPVEVAFEPAAFASRSTPRPPPDKSPLPKPTGRDLIEDDPEWAAFSYDALQGRLEAQRRKPTRLRIPSWDEVARNTPDGLFERPSDIVWYRIVFGYAPELAAPFEYYMRTVGSEAAGRWDRLFGSGLFWVVTRAVKCPYCMGHCEMNWEVAGLTRGEVAERSRLLAGDDWSSFPPAEQRAFAFARKLSSAPWSVSVSDVDTLNRDFGPDLASFVMLNASRYHYMTRISNGFQLRLERENVFYDYYNVKPPGEASGGSPGGPPAALLSDEECWRRMPPASSGGGGPLPSWAKAVATRLPRTAAAMLELDLAQRTRSPLDPLLRAKMRWVIAHANHCAYSEAYALADLRRAGGDEAAVKALTGDPSGWPAADRAPLEFARLHTISAPTIPDELFARLRGRFGDKKVAAMVLLGAYGNFQDRIVLGLDLPAEPGGPLAPLDVKFEPGAFQETPILPAQSDAPRLLASGTTVVDRDPEWSELTYEELQSRLDRQRARTSRLPVPSWDEVKKGLPAAFAARPTRIVWNLVSAGYVPELAVPWSVSTRTMWAEAAQDRVLEESLFWVQTRAVRCNYCMGHCEMLLEVAGLDRDAVAERTRRLAGDDWSAFPPAEQRAFAYARKLSKTPWDLTPADYRALERDFGPEKAMAVFWWLCRGLYMTRVSDGFQLPLERDNVFADHAPQKPGAAGHGRSNPR